MAKNIQECVRRYPVLAACEKEMMQAFACIRDAYANKAKLLLCGNGGSASDSDHISGELLKGFGQKRPLSKEWQDRLGAHLASKLQGSLPALPLPMFASLMTAYANDCDAEYVYAQLVWGLGNAGDALLCLSTSGNSKNVLRAAEVAQAKGLFCIGLTGKTGGQLKELMDVCICVPETEVYKIQELHLPIYHALCLDLEAAFFPAHDFVSSIAADAH